MASVKVSGLHLEYNAPPCTHNLIYKFGYLYIFQCFFEFVARRTAATPLRLVPGAWLCQTLARRATSHATLVFHRRFNVDLLPSRPQDSSHAAAAAAGRLAAVEARMERLVREQREKREAEAQTALQVHDCSIRAMRHALESCCCDTCGSLPCIGFILAVHQLCFVSFD